MDGRKKDMTGAAERGARSELDQSRGCGEREEEPDSKNQDRKFAFTAESPGSIPGRKNKIPEAPRGQKKISK